MSRYAVATDVSPARSREEIERLLVRYGASEFGYAWRDNVAELGFATGGLRVRFRLPMPDRNAREFTHTPERGLPRNAAAQAVAYDQAVKQRWRALALVIKAKLEAVDAGITTLEEEFLAHVVVGEQTVGEVIIPQITTGALALPPGGGR